MFESHRAVPAIPCFIVTDAVGLKKYGLGMVRMGTRDLGPFLADGYLIKGDTVAELAAKLEDTRPALEQTIAAMNAYAKTGVDPNSAAAPPPITASNGDAWFERTQSDPGADRNAAYYAVRLYPGDIGAATGLVIDEWSRVLKEGNEPIEGLYACGNEANSIMGGTYPGLASRSARHHLRLSRDPARAAWIGGGLKQHDAPSTQDLNMTEYSLAYLTSVPLSPADALILAGKLGYRYTGVRIAPASPGGDFHPLATDAAMLRETIARSKDAAPPYSMSRSRGWPRILRSKRSRHFSKPAARLAPAPSWWPATIPTRRG